MADSVSGNFEHLLQRLYESFLRPGDVAIDVGAHVGHHTFPIAKRVSPGGRVLAFEPLDACREQIVGRVRDEGLANVVSVFPFAIGGENGDAEFVVAVDAPGYSGLRERVYDSPTRLDRRKVHVRTLDGFTSDLSRLDYVKIDVECGEYDVVRGARALLLRYRPVVTFEFGASSFGKYGITGFDMIRLWAELKYVVYDIRGTLFVDHGEFAASAIRQEVWDYVAVPEERAAGAASLLEAVGERGRRGDRGVSSLTWQASALN